jgi:hypothetical protein
MSEIGNQTKEQVNALTRSVAAIAAIAMIASGCSKDPGTGFDFVPEVATEALEPTPSATPESAYDPQAMAAIRALFTKQENPFADEDIRTGDDVDQADNPMEAGSASFTTEELGVIDSNEELAAFFVLDSAKAEAARARIESNLTDEPEELARVLSGEYHIPVQFMKDIVVKGTTYLVDGDVVKMTSGREAAAGDIFWIYVDLEGKVRPELSMRADCNNPEFDEIEPKEDDGNLPGIDEVPADQDKGTPDKAGVGPAGQEPDDEGKLPTETLPTPKPAEPTEEATEEATEEPTPEATEEPGTPENPIETKDEDQQEAPAQDAEEDKTSDGTTEDNGGADNTTKPAKP